jgi:hypothetical protein
MLGGLIGTVADITCLESMPRYHFDLVDHHTVEDHGGQVLADDIVASDVADELARRIYDLCPELRGKGYSIHVRDSEGCDVYRAPIDTSNAVPPPFLN